MLDKPNAQTEQELSISLVSGDEADVYYKKFRSNNQLPLVIFLQGALTDKKYYNKFGRALASSNYIVIVPNHFQTLPTGECTTMLRTPFTSFIPI